ncbi:hypothetical protein ACQKKK_12765 [Peribacillus sp. NPDC006672]|uniref:hypothetical protein n=1 Tax=Peribacillus sp. NPDC006672 TaxID=3390606 RepID=UPI003D072455
MASPHNSIVAVHQFVNLLRKLEIRKMLENYSIQKAFEGITEEELIKKTDIASNRTSPWLKSPSSIAL